MCVVNQPAGPDGPDDYVLGRSDSETRRLILQHQIYGPITREFLIAAGITTGMKVLDVGSGAGDVVMLLAELVGPQGDVVGIDSNDAILAIARERVRATGRTNVAFHAGDLHDLEPGDDFDAVVGRWVLMYVPDPSDLLRRVQAWLRPGGIVAFQEGDMRNPVRPYPPAAFHEQLLRWMTPPPGAPGPEIEMGLKLFSAYTKSGLGTPQVRMAAPIGGGADWPGYAYLAGTFRSLLPFLERAGALQPGDVDVDTVEDRLRDEIVSQDGVQILPALIGAWARKR
jgi:SAM-dependent methyltransferase